MGNKSKRNGVPQPITRRQQVEALRKLKADEVAANLADKIREAVQDEVDRQLKAVKDTVMSTIDRVMDVEKIIQDWTVDNEGDCDDRQERAEGSPVPEDDEVVREQVVAGEDDPGEGGTEGPTSG